MHPNCEVLCRVYEYLYEQGQVSFPLYPNNRDALDSVVKTVEQSYFGVPRFGNDQDKAVAYLCHIIKRHALTDGNKRLAILWFQVFCDIHGLHPNPKFPLDEFAVAIEGSPLDMDELLEVVGRLLHFS